MIERLLRNLGEALQDEESRRRFVAHGLVLIRRILAVLTVFFIGSLITVTLGLRFAGEQNVTTAFLLYVPRQVFLLPLPFLVLITIPFDWRQVVIQIFAAIAFVLVAMGWQIHPAPVQQPEAGSIPLTVLTYNRGENQGQSLQPFKDLIQPDVIILQDAPSRSALYAKAEGYAEFPHAQSVGEFTFLSRYPITGATPVTVVSHGRTVPVAARVELEVEGQKVVVFGVHFRSPRDHLRGYWRGAFLYGVLGIPGTPFSEKRRRLQDWWNDRLSQVDQFLLVVDRETAPVLVAGDFNAPSGGVIHHRIASALRDAHLTAGHGFGFTFPGGNRNPLSLGGPWMRIDYIFAGPDWRVVDCVTEEKRPSQHRALAATFIMTPGHP
jgi:endonuclease/exonuclease/phosphatase (EEP) superfamily protein YafD